MCFVMMCLKSVSNRRYHVKEKCGFGLEMEPFLTGQENSQHGRKESGCLHLEDTHLKFRVAKMDLYHRLYCD